MGNNNNNKIDNIGKKIRKTLKSKYDPLGIYTGVPTQDEKHPVQDADDL